VNLLFQNKKNIFFFLNPDTNIHRQKYVYIQDASFENNKFNPYFV